MRIQLFFHCEFWLVSPVCLEFRHTASALAQWIYLFLFSFPFFLRQGGLLVNFHPSILTCLLPQLTSPRLAVRKRTIIALGHLVMSCGNIVFVDLIEHLLSELSKNDSMSTTRTYIQCIAAISRQAGHRIGKAFQSTSTMRVCDASCMWRWERNSRVGFLLHLSGVWGFKLRPPGSCRHLCPLSPSLTGP